MSIDSQKPKNVLAQNQREKKYTAIKMYAKGTAIILTTEKNDKIEFSHKSNVRYTTHTMDPFMAYMYTYFEFMMCHNSFSLSHPDDDNVMKCG